MLNAKKTVKVLHLITTLSLGGAEMMLYKLLSRLDRRIFVLEVVSLTDVGPVGKKIQNLGVPVRALGMNRGQPNPWGLLRLVRLLREDPPHVLQTWMYHADLIGGLAAKLTKNIKVVWGLRQSNLDLQVNKRSTVWTALACARLSRWLPERIVCCSEASRRLHEEVGYAAKKMLVIPNGFDLDTFRPDSTARQTVRQELSISQDALLIGLIGRFDPQKDHANFIQAAARLHTCLPNVHFLLCGDGVNWKNQVLVEWIKVAGIQACCHFLGRRDDIPRINAALDLASSSSCGEGFPNVIGEAMACGVPCVVTDVGDSALIVGDTGRVVPPKNPHALARAWYELIERGPEHRRRLGAAARCRVRKHYSLQAIATQYEKLYEESAPYVRH